MNYLLAALLFVTSQATIWTAAWAAIQYVNRREAVQIAAILERGAPQRADVRPRYRRGV
jgi:hypothetical protein